jgi:hypothetical protein
VDKPKCEYETLRLKIIIKGPHDITVDQSQLFLGGEGENILEDYIFLKCFMNSRNLFRKFFYNTETLSETYL